MLIITLLGTGNYQKTTYEWKENDKTCAYTTEFFPEAIAHFFQPDKIMALVTSQAKAHANFKNFCDRLPGLIEAIDIPEGKSEQDLWAIFDKCAAAIDEKETIILDITHAFRSLPLYVFTVAAYLRRTKGVKTNISSMGHMRRVTNETIRPPWIYVALEGVSICTSATN